ncbi:unnamed protein product [Polarella glacialis]|uniref:Uncharacterized protein n=1 Tax=Polarella glacialis TaxID=89957 RepID=A0A813JWH8_POLGL|nr:unnamed protein product [Polarella glacialis]
MAATSGAHAANSGPATTATATSTTPTPATTLTTTTTTTTTPAKPWTWEVEEVPGGGDWQALGACPLALIRGLAEGSEGCLLGLGGALGKEATTTKTKTITGKEAEAEAEAFRSVRYSGPVGDESCTGGDRLQPPRLELYELHLFADGPRFGGGVVFKGVTRVRLAAPCSEQPVQRLRPREKCWAVGSCTGGWINCPQDFQSRLSLGLASPLVSPHLAAPVDLGRCECLAGWRSGGAGMLTASPQFRREGEGEGFFRPAGAEDSDGQPLAMGFLDGWADEGGGPYRLTVTILSWANRTADSSASCLMAFSLPASGLAFIGRRSRRPREKQKQKPPRQAKESRPDCEVEVDVAGFASAEGLWIVDQAAGRKFQLAGDLLTCGGFSGTLGADGSSGTFHLRPSKQAFVQQNAPNGTAAAGLGPAIGGPGSPPWLAGQWAVVDREKFSLGILNIRNKPNLSTSQVVHELDLKNIAGPEGVRLRVSFCPELTQVARKTYLRGLRGSQEALPEAGQEQKQLSSPREKEALSHNRNNNNDNNNNNHNDEALSAPPSWQLAPGELQRLGGPEVQGEAFLFEPVEGKQVLALQQPLDFSLCPVLEFSLRDSEQGSRKDKGEKTREGKRETAPSALQALRLGPPSQFPQALLGRWVRIMGGRMSEIDILDDFSCHEVGMDSPTPFQVFPEIVYLNFGRWLLNLSRSSASILVWLCDLSPAGVAQDSIVLWTRPWLAQGWLEVKGARGSNPAVHGSYRPDFSSPSKNNNNNKNNSIRFCRVRRQSSEPEVELRQDEGGAWRFACCSSNNNSNNNHNNNHNNISGARGPSGEDQWRIYDYRPPSPGSDGPVVKGSSDALPEESDGFTGPPLGQWTSPGQGGGGGGGGGGGAAPLGLQGGLVISRPGDARLQQEALLLDFQQADCSSVPPRIEWKWSSLGSGIRWNVLPQELLMLPSLSKGGDGRSRSEPAEATEATEERGKKQRPLGDRSDDPVALFLSQGLLEIFAGDVVVDLVTKATAGSSLKKRFGLASCNDDFEIEVLMAGVLPATWCIHVCVQLDELELKTWSLTSASARWELPIARRLQQVLHLVLQTAVAIRALSVAIPCRLAGDEKLPKASGFGDEEREASGGASSDSPRAPLCASSAGDGSAQNSASAELLAGAALRAALELAKSERAKGSPHSSCPKELREGTLLEVHLIGSPGELRRCSSAVREVAETERESRSGETFQDRMKAASADSSPAWLTAAVLGRLQRGGSGLRKEAWRKQLRQDPAVRGASLAQILGLAELVQEVLEQGSPELHERPFQLPKSGEAASTATMTTYTTTTTKPKVRLLWKNVNMYHVCQHFVLPLTKAEGCSYVELVASELQPPQWLVSHAWSTAFAATANMLTQHGRARSNNGSFSGPSELSPLLPTTPQQAVLLPDPIVYWICTLANNQHDLSGLHEADLLKTPFGRVLLSPSTHGTVLLCDQAVTPLRRVWCVLELHLTQQLRTAGGASGLGKVASAWHFLDLVAETGAPGGGVGILEDAAVSGGGSWHEVSGWSGLAPFPLEVARCGTEVDIRLAQASLEEDRRAILSHITDNGRSCRSQPAPEQHEAYDKLNDFVHAAFASAELYRLVCERPADCVEKARRLLARCRDSLDPNSFVRQGNTALFALVGADPSHPSAAEPALLQEMLALLIDSKADVNHVNSNLQTALDCVCSSSSSSSAGGAESFLLSHGALPFAEAAVLAERSFNARLEEVLARGGFGAPVLGGPVKAGQAFGGSGGGGSGAKLLGRAEQSLREAAASLKLYPSVLCTISTPAGAQDRLAQRGKVVLAALQAAGCRNPFELQTAGTYHPRGSVPQLRISVAFCGTQSGPSVESGSLPVDGPLPPRIRRGQSVSDFAAAAVQHITAPLSKWRGRGKSSKVAPDK